MLMTLTALLMSGLLLCGATKGRMDQTGTGYSSVTTDDITVDSNTESAEAMRANFGIADTPPDAPIVPSGDDEPEPAPDPEPEKPAAVDAKSPALDKRTKEGRKAAIQAEIDALTKTKYDTQREIDAAKAEITRLRAEATKPAEKPAAASADDPEPTPSGFDTYEKYVKAQARWEARQEAKELRAQWDKERLAHEQAQADAGRAQAWRDRLAKAREKYPDFDQQVKPDLPMSTPLIDLVKDSDVGPELLLHLSAHPDLAQRLSTLHPIQLIRELGRLEERVSAAPVEKTGPARASASQAKPPITPVTASPQIAEPDEGADDEDVDAFIARENAKARKAGRR